MNRPLRCLGIQIANGFSPEARVFASLLMEYPTESIGSLPIKFDVIHQSSAEDPESAQRFRLAVAPTVNVHLRDFGWRRIDKDITLAAKLHSRLRLFSQLPAVLRQARNLRPDVIYSCQQRWDCLVATYISQRLKCRQVIHLHYVVGPWLHKPVLHRLLTCDLVIAISDFIRSEAIQHGVLPENVITIRNSVVVPDTLAAKTVASGIREELGIARQAPLVGIIARLDPQKGQHDAIRACAQLLRRFPTGNLLIVGSETSWHAGYEASLKKLVADLDISDRVWFLGHRNDVPQILSNLDVFVHPAHNEPFGLAVAEASAAGLPVVAYADGATPELIDDGVTGLLSSRGDSIEGLAKNLETLMSNPARSREIGMLGRSRMQAQFSGVDAVRNFRLAIIRAMSSVPGGTNSVATSRNFD